MCMLCIGLWSFFFFSSRRRHTRCSRDWSSDVCSSDLFEVAFNTGDFKDVGFNSALSETHSFSPTLINELRFGYSRIHTTQLQPLGDTMGVPAQYGINGIPQLPTNGGLPRLDISGLSSLGAVAV